MRARKFDQLQCYLCKEYGHKARDCNRQTASALFFISFQQIQKGAKVPLYSAAASVEVSNENCTMSQSDSIITDGTKPFSDENTTEAEVEACIKDGKLTLCHNMPVTKGKVEDDVVDTLRDSGCSGKKERQCITVET